MQLPDCSKLTVSWKNGNDVTIFRHEVIVKFSYWSQFHFNITTGSGVTRISFYKGWTRNPEAGNTPVGIFPISGDWGK